VPTVVFPSPHRYHVCLVIVIAIAIEAVCLVSPLSACL